MGPHPTDWGNYFWWIQSNLIKTGIWVNLKGLEGAGVSDLTNFGKASKAYSPPENTRPHPT